MSNPKRRVLSFLLTAAMIFSMVPMTGFATESCTHEHDQACGYVEGADCTHAHNEGCSEDGADCPHEHDQACGYIESADCAHEHDADCGGISVGDSGDPSNPATPTDVVIAALDELDEATLYQGYDFDTATLADLDLPGTLTGEDEDENPVTIKGVVWECTSAKTMLGDVLDTVFAPEISAFYEFSPVLPEGYILAEGVTAPVISVFIRPEGGVQIAPMAIDQNSIEMGLANAKTEVVTLATFDTHATGTGWSWSGSADYTLTVYGIDTGLGVYDGAPIVFYGDTPVTLHVVGDVTITESNSNWSTLYSQQSLTITGSGSLTVKGAGFALHVGRNANGSNLTINMTGSGSVTSLGTLPVNMAGGGTLSVTGGTVNIGGNVTGNLDVSGGTVTVTGTVSGTTSHTGGTLTVLNGAPITSNIQIDTVSAGGAGYTWDSANGVVTITADGTYNITQNNSGAATPNRIVVNDNLTGVTLAINGLNIVAPDTANGAPAIALGAGSNVALQLSGSNALTGTRAYAGIQTSDATLTINGNGSLTVIGGSGWGNAAGIGGNSYEMGTVGNGGIIIVNNGTITTQRLGCGGNGGDDANGGNGGHVTINGGTIKGVNTQLRIASGGSSSNGYACGTGGTVIINGGFIDNINDATIGEGGASGNGGTGGNGGNVTINGGTVIAYAIARGGKGSGSGVCHGGNGGTVEITGGSVNANAANVAAGGTSSFGGIDGTAGTITNGGGNVYLTTLTVGSTPVADTEIIGITAPTGYGINDVKTDTSGMLYFWLPTSVTEVSLNTADYIYSNSAVTVKSDHTGEATLTQGSTTPPAATGAMDIGGQTGISLASNTYGTGWTWTAGTATLTLTSAYEGAPIAINCLYTDTINLAYTGNVSITSAAAGTLYCAGYLNITGNGGTLTLNSQSTNSQYCAIEAYAGALTIGGAAVVNATSAGSGANPDAAVIFGNAGVTISGSASVIATATGADASGIWSASGDLTISTNGTIMANGNGTGSALRLNGSLRKLNVTSGTLNLTGNPMNFDTYIAPVITGGTVEISGTQVYLATLTLSGVNTETTITAVTAPASGYGIQRMKSDANGKLYFWLPAGSQTVTLTAGGNTYTGTITVTANHTTAATLARASVPAITSANNTTFTVGTAGNFTVAASNSPTSFAYTGTLPSGVSFNTATGVLSGTPAAGTNGTYSLSFTATNAGGTSTAQSFSLTVTLPKAAVPTTASFNGADMSLTGVTTGMSYSLNGGATYTQCGNTTVDLSAASVTTANGIWVIMRGDNINNVDSDPQKLTISKAAAPSGVGKTDETADDADDGTLTGVTTAMEYSLSGAASWIDGTGSTITGLAPGTYRVRIKGGINTLPSDHIALTIGAYGDTAVTFSGVTANGTANTTTTTELTLTFDQAVTGLTAANITLIGGTGSAAKGTLTHVSGGTYKLGVTVSAAGSITVEVSSPAGFAINPASQSVTVHQMTVTNHTVTFILNGGNRIGGGALTQTVPNGGAATAPIVTRSGYTFNGWDKSFTNVTQNLTVTAQWRTILDDSSNDSSSSGGSSTADISTWKTTITSDTDMPVKATITIPGKVDANGNLTANVTEAMIKDAITKAQAEATKLGKTGDGIIVEINITATGAKSLTVKVDDAALSRLSAAGAGASVKSEIFQFALDAAAVKQVNTQSSGGVTFTALPTDKLSSAAQAAIGIRPVFDFNLADGTGKTITSYGNGTITRGIKYSAVSGEQTGNLFAVKVLDNGSLQWITESSYTGGWLIWSGSSNSVYGVGYKTPAPAFTDTAGHWAKDNIDFVASRGLFSGTSATTFSPNTSITRGMFVTALGRLSGQDMSGYTTSSFTDVKAGSYYLSYIEWAVEHKIVQGIGNNQFAPDKAITREEMAVMIYNYAKATNYTLPASRSAVTFTDDAQISTWAAAAVKALQQAGIVSGVGDGKFNPKGTATRAEAATILRNFVEGIIDESTARGWAKNEAGQWMYWTWDGKLHTGWLNVTTGSRYYMDENGIMVSGKWVQIGGKWYYFYADGKLATNTTIDGYKVGADGAREN